jgi:hypothetical protein
MAVIGVENAGAAPPILEWMEQRMPERRHFTQTTSLKECLTGEATQLRKAESRHPLGIFSRVRRNKRQHRKFSKTGEFCRSRSV